MSWESAYRDCVFFIFFIAKTAKTTECSFALSADLMCKRYKREKEGLKKRRDPPSSASGLRTGFTL